MAERVCQRSTHFADSQLALPGCCSLELFAGLTLIWERKRCVRNYGSLPTHLQDALGLIEPSRGGDLDYFPCRVVLRNGQTLNRVYRQPEMPDLRHWGVRPEDDTAKLSRNIEHIRRRSG